MEPIIFVVVLFSIPCATFLLARAVWRSLGP